MIAYRYDPATNLYAGTQERQLDPVETANTGVEVYLTPADCTDVEPLEEKEGYNIKWNGSAWEYVEAPKEEEPPTHEETEPTTEQKIASLDAQYSADKSTLQGYYVTYMIAGDEEGMADIKAELEALAEEYDSNLAELKGEE